TLIWAPPRRASTPDESGEGLELIGDEAAGRRVRQFACFRVDLRVDLGNNDLRAIKSARIEVDEHVAQVKLGAQAAEGAGRRALDRDRLAGERLIRQPGNPVDGVLEHARDR